MGGDRYFLSEYMPELIDLEIPQFQLLDVERFISFLQARDIRISKEELEHFEKMGYLYPVLRLKRKKIEENGRVYFAGISSSSQYLKGYLKAGRLEFPNSTNFREWDNYREENGEKNTFIFYHPYQVFIITRFLNFTHFLVTSRYIDSGTNFEERFKQMKRITENVGRSILKSRPNLVKQIGLLLQLQNAYQPDYRGRVTLTFDEKSLERWFDWRKKIFSPSKVLENNGIKLKEIKDLRNYFAAQANFSDPMAKWYPLIRLIAFAKKEKLKGKALLAQDYYEIVGILNFFLQELTGEKQPEPDDILDGRGGEWKDRYYGKKFDYDDPEIRKKIIFDFTRNVPIPKLVLLVEGDSEEISINILFNAFGLVPENEGITIHNFEGTGGITPFNSGAILQFAKSQNVARYLIIDDDLGAKELVIELTERLHLLDSDCYKMWERDFEYDNFGIEKIVEIVNEKLVEQNLEPIINGEVEDRLNRLPDERLWKAIHSVCWMKNKIEVDDVISKTILARMLSLKRVEEIKDEQKNNKYKPKLKIEQEIINIHNRFCR